MKTLETEHITERLVEIYLRKQAVDCDTFLPLVAEVRSILRNEYAAIRPPDDNGLPGGLLYLDTEKDTIIVPDIHARTGFMISLLLHADENGITLIEQLARGEAQIVCVGDGMHAESRAARRWVAAKKEYKRKFKKKKNMDEEMRESFGVMEMVMELKRAFPADFHYLKGNHDNIANERGKGNYPFMKFAFEGPMVTEYVLTFYGIEFLKYYYSFEKNLPLLAIGKNFIVSHAEPEYFYSPCEVINFRKRPEIVAGLTWTDDEESIHGTVASMIEEYIAPGFQNEALYFGGHRPVSGYYNMRANGRYIQIHNPNKFIVAHIKNEKAVNLKEDIIEIDDLATCLFER